MSVDLVFNGQHLHVAPGLSLFDCAEASGIRVPTSCDKQGRCKECLVEVTEGMTYLSDRSPEEEHLQDRFRLSCRARIIAPFGLVRCHTMRRGDMRIESRAFHLPVPDHRFERRPAVTRDGDRILLDGREIDRSDGPLHGVALDLGTTTLVLRLLDLESGTVVAQSSFENPQRFGGSDVMSRIHYDTLHPDRILQRTLAGYLTHAIEEFPVDPHTIYEMVVAGNSTMRDIFFQLNVHPIGQSPYRSITETEVQDGRRATTSLTASPRRLLLPLHPRARIYGLPIISGHVGADAAACMLAIHLADEERLVALMDIGTNTELIVGNRHRILAASCPAGPAFEGGRVSCGMPGLPGAIERVHINDDGSCTCSIIGDAPAQGICGSGLVDTLSELLRKGHLNPLGRFQNGQNEILLAANGDRRVSLTEADINELAQAKGANVAGLHIVLERYGVRFSDIDTFYLAGGFGRHMSIESSKRIGLIPNIDDSRIVQIGNAAIEGACMALLSLPKRLELERLVSTVVHCRLETHPEFFNYFVEGCQFRPVESVSPMSSGS